MEDDQKTETKEDEGKDYDEKKEEQRKKGRERLKRYREKLKRENIEKLREIGRTQAKKYRQKMSDEKKEEIKKKAREQHRRYRERMSIERKEQMKLVAREQTKAFREKIKYQNEEDFKRMERERVKRYRENLSHEKKELMKRKAREQKRKYRETLSSQKREEIKIKAREQHRVYRERLSDEKKEHLKLLAKEQKRRFREKFKYENEDFREKERERIKKYRENLSREKREYLKEKAREQQKKYREKISGEKKGLFKSVEQKKKCESLINTHNEHISFSKDQMNRLNDDVQYKYVGFNNNIELCGGPNGIDDIVNEEFLAEILEEEITQCCRCGLILTNKKRLIDHIKTEHSKSFEVIEQLRKNILLVHKIMAIKGKKSTQEGNENLQISSTQSLVDVDIDTESKLLILEKIISKSLQGSKIVCNICGLILSCKEHLECHVNVKHTENNFEQVDSQMNEMTTQCPICEESCGIFALYNHINNVHCSKRNMSSECNDCGLVFKSDECLADHFVDFKLKINYLNFKEFQVCSYPRVNLEKESSGNESTDLEKLSSLNDSSKLVKVFKCKYCDYVHRYSYGLLKHILKNHLFECPHECPFCDFKSKRYEHYLKKHIESMHPDTNINSPFICEMCGYVTHNETTFKHHNRSHWRKYECEYCDYTTCLSSSIDVHRRKHTKQKPFKCDFEGCNYEFSQKSALTTHRFTHNPEKYLQFCDVCGFKSVNKYLMKSHIKGHKLKHDTFSCIQCPYTTNIKTLYINHSKVHRELMQCTLCEFKTKYNVTMKKHMRTKHDINNYQ